MKVLIPGSYDPCTRGHLDLIERAAARYEEVIAAVFINPEKSGLFPYRERVNFLRLATAHLPNVTVTFSDGMVADYVRENAIDQIVKGYRDERDLQYEKTMADYNLAHSGVGTELLPAAPAYVSVSSTAVREALASGHGIETLVPPEAAPAIRAAYEKVRKSSKMDKVTKIDGGTLKERIQEMKDFFGLDEKQSFQDLDVDNEKSCEKDRES